MPSPIPTVSDSEILAMRERHERREAANRAAGNRFVVTHAGGPLDGLKSWSAKGGGGVISFGCVCDTATGIAVANYERTPQPGVWAFRDWYFPGREARGYGLYGSGAD